ncbi:MAG TPA: glycosyltransferase family 2 protein [Dehalococcoidia bacterium]|nr:glycosyltransferase family 2 protein [Dehalococcoidia bacterium]
MAYPIGSMTEAAPKPPEPAQAKAPRLPGSETVSVVIPCLNEALSVGRCVEQAVEGLGVAGVGGEVIVVDNGSTDGSPELAEAAGARVLREAERGKGHAARTGIRESSGDFVILADADGTYDLRELKPLIDLLREGYDMVVGNRLKGHMAPKAMPRLHRYIGNPLIGLVIALVSGRRFGDCLSGLRAFRRAAWYRIAPKSPGFELETEICLRAGRHRLKVHDVPISYFERQTPSKLSGPRDGWRIIRFILIDSADRIFLVPGVAGLILGALLLRAGFYFSAFELGSARWEAVFAGSVLAPASLAAIVLGLATRWLHWQRGVVADPGAFVRSLGERRARRMEMFFAFAAVCLVVGLSLDISLLVNHDYSEPSPLALMATAQALVVLGAEVVAGAILFGVLRGIPIVADSELDLPQS